MDAQEDKKVDDVSEGKKFGPCMNCGYPRTAHDWKIPGRYCSNYLARDPAPAQPVADAQGETAQGEANPCYCGKDACVGVDSIKAGYFCKRAEPSQQENALQPQPAEAVKSLSDRDFVAAIASLSLDMDYSDSEALAAITKRCYDRIDFLAKYKPQPAESDGLEVAKEKWLRDNNYSCFTDASEETFDAGWQASRQSLLNKANEWERTLGIAGCVKDKSTPVGWVNRRAEAAEAKLSSLLAQKPEATVSFDRLAEVYNDSPLDGSVSHLCIEVMKYRQLFKDAEKGMR